MGAGPSCVRAGPLPTVCPRRAEELPALAVVLRAVHDHSGYPTVCPPDPLHWLDPPGLLGAWVVELGGVLVAHGALKDEDRGG